MTAAVGRWLVSLFPWPSSPPHPFALIRFIPGQKRARGRCVCCRRRRRRASCRAGGGASLDFTTGFYLCAYDCIFFFFFQLFLFFLFMWDFTSEEVRIYTEKIVISRSTSDWEENNTFQTVYIQLTIVLSHSTFIFKLLQHRFFPCIIVMRVDLFRMVWVYLSNMQKQK